MNTDKEIKELLGKIRSLIGDDKKSIEWFHEVQAKASTFETDKEEIAYLEDILTKLQDSDDEAQELEDSDDEAQELEDSDDEAQELEEVRSNPWPIISLFFGIVIAVAIIFGFWYFLFPRNANATGSTTTVSSSTISKSVDLPKEEFQIIDYKVDGGDVVYNREIANTQHKVFVNGSEENSISSSSKDAVNEMIQYMSHNATALKEKAMAFGIIDAKTDVKDWLTKSKDGNLYYNEKGKDVFYQTKAFLSRSQTSSKKMSSGSNYYTTGVNDKGDVVISRQAQNLSGQEYIEVSNPKDSTEKYSYRVLVYCGNTVMQRNDIPGIPTENIEIPKPNKPGKPGEPDKPSESKVEKKDPSKDPANQGKAPVGGGQNDGSSNGSETSQAKLPEQYSAPSAPAAPVQSSSSSSATTSSQDARVSEPSQWSGSGTVTDSNGSTKVEENGAVTTPDGRKYDGLVGKSAPKVESGANDTTKPSSSANFAGVNGSMNQPAIDD